MQKIRTFMALMIAALLTACSHGAGGNTMPSAQNNGTSPSAALRQKMLREQQPIPSSFVAPKHPGYMAETPSEQNWPTGIEQAGQAPVPGGMFDIVNQYNAVMNGEPVTVYAGSLKTTGAGILLVVRRSPDLHTADAQTYTVASRAVKIVGAADGQLQLQTVGAGAGTPPQAIPFRLPL